MGLQGWQIAIWLESLSRKGVIVDGRERAA